MNPTMYISPAIVTMFTAMLMAFLSVGAVLWKLAMVVGDIKRDVAIIAERLDGHIKACGHQDHYS